MQQKLNDIMQFEHVVRVHEDGSVTDESGVYAPDLLDEELSDDRWAFFSTGYTRQDSYNGPIMHNSEFIGGRLERDILETPGVYAAVVAYWTSDEDDEEGPDIEGWAIVRLKD